MRQNKKMPVGIEDFRKLVEGYYFVDKTKFIVDLIDCHVDVTLLARPRRFGKTLTLSMLKYFFDMEHGEANRALFHGLRIEQAGSRYMAQQGSRPVVFFTLKDVKAATFSGMMAMMAMTFHRLYGQFLHLIEQEALNSAEKEYFSRVLHRQASAEELQYAVCNLMDYLCRCSGRPVLLLIDEYDGPIQFAWEHGYYSEAIPFFRNFYSAALKTNPALDFAVVTGVLRISKESIFSALNNLEVSSVLKGPYPDAMGFTQDEVAQMASGLGFADKLQELREWYDGYIFSGLEIYNPWSVINYFRQGCKPDLYWVNTSGNGILADMLENADAEQEKDLHALLARESITATINENVIYADIQKSRNALYMILLATGYLKAVPAETDDLGFCALEIPNQEVRRAYAAEVIARLGRTAAQGDPSRLLAYLTSGKAAEFERELTFLLEAVISCHDTAKNPEAFYHGFLNGMLSILAPRTYEVQSNRESGFGRFDIALFPKRSDRAGVVMEFKAASSVKTLNAKAKEALAQIESRDYAAEFRQRGVREIWLYGIAFRGKRTKLAIGSKPSI